MIEEDNKGLAGLILKQHVIDILLMLKEEGPKTDKKIVDKFQVNESDRLELYHLLGEMRGFELIDHHYPVVFITSYGETIVKNFKKDTKKDDK